MLPQAPIKVIVIGSGGREHALCWKLSQSPLVERIYCTPGNGGTATLARTVNVGIAAGSFDELAEFALKERVELVVVGPDNPLADGIVDVLEAKGLRVFGPDRAGARLEWSKAHAKEFMKKAGIPTADFLVCDSLEQGQIQVSENQWARVVKVDGLALGKGVYVCDSEEETLAALDEIFKEKRFGSSGERVVMEEKLAGEEISLLAFCDGKRLVTLPPCQDHKRRFDGDSGPNTGGMGAYSPVPLYERCKNEIAEQVLAPLEAALQNGTLNYKGLLYIGLMMVSEEKPSGSGQTYRPYVLEFNARFGDPETQALLPRLKSDLLPALWACTEGTLDQVKLDWSEQASCCVVAVTESYPESSSKGKAIAIGELSSDAILFYAGAAIIDGRISTAGGRILSVTGLAPSMEAASAKAYAGLKSISFEGMAYRKDIARRAIEQCLSS